MATVTFTTAELNAIAAQVAVINAPPVVTPPVVVPPVVVPPSTRLAVVSIVGNSLAINGVKTQIRGFNFTGLENTAIQGWNPSNPWGDGGGTEGLAAAVAWKPSGARIPWNAASWLGLTTYDTASAITWGSPRKADPGANYQATFFKAIEDGRAAGLKAQIVDLHWTAPNMTLGGVTHPLSPMGQMSGLDANMGKDAWVSMVNALNARYGATGWTDLILEAVNEPYLNSNGGTLSAGSADIALINGGTSDDVINNSQGGANFELKGNVWPIWGYQDFYNTMRNMGVNNVLLFGGNQWSQNLQNAKTWLPKDTSGKVPTNVGVAYHYYPQGAYPYTNTNPKIGTDTPGATPTFWADSLLNAGICVVVTEMGGHGGTLVTSEPFISQGLAWLDKMGVSVFFWQFNGTQPSVAGIDYFLTVFGADGKTVLPIPGYGQVVHDWMVNHK